MTRVVKHGFADYRPPAKVRALKAAGYDGTITLEVFTPDRNHLVYSRDLLRRTWDEA